jgi:hypothetical protein
MKVLLIEKLIPMNGLPRTSSHKLSADILYSLVGYQHTHCDLTVMVQEVTAIQDHDIYKKVVYKLEEFEDTITQLSVNKYDCVVTFDFELVKRCKDLPISNLIFCAMDMKSFLTQEEKELLSLPWIKVISFLPRLSDIEGMKINKSCNPTCSYMADVEVDPLPPHEGRRIIVPIDGRFDQEDLIVSPIDLINGIVKKILANYFDATIIVAMVGARVIYLSQSPKVQVVGVQSLGEYLNLLRGSDLQVCYSIKYTLDLFPFYGMEFGIPTALISEPSFIKDYPYLPYDQTEILGVNSLEMESMRVINPDFPTYLRSLAGSFDEVKFNIDFQTAFRSVANIAYREEFRESIEDKLKETEEFYKNHPELNENVIKQLDKEHKNEHPD